MCAARGSDQHMLQHMHSMKLMCRFVKYLVVGQQVHDVQQAGQLQLLLAGLRRRRRLATLALCRRLQLDRNRPSEKEDLGIAVPEPVQSACSRPHQSGRGAARLTRHW